jgi:(4S)-4-hydroxy-5-phosphonooxypentane-2,3-dione isomerase
MHIVLVHIHLKPEHIEAFEAATNENAANSRLEPGVVRFDVLRRQDEEARYLLVEIYRDLDAAAAHKATDHYLAWRDTVASFMAEPRQGVAYTNVSPADHEW